MNGAPDQSPAPKSWRDIALEAERQLLSEENLGGLVNEDDIIVTIEITRAKRRDIARSFILAKVMHMVRTAPARDRAMLIESGKYWRARWPHITDIQIKDAYRAVVSAGGVFE